MQPLFQTVDETTAKRTGSGRLGRALLRLAPLWTFAGAAFAQHPPPSEADARHAQLREASLKTFEENVTPFIRAYCFECHGDKKQKGGVTFRSALKNPAATAFLKQWKGARSTVETKEMPPEDAANQPSAEEREVFSRWVTDLKYISPKDPGTFVIRRLNRTEYKSEAAARLPDEVIGEGYLNALPPLLMEQYLGVANELLGKLREPDGTPLRAALTRLFGETVAVPPAGTPAPALRELARQGAAVLARKAYRRPAAAPEVELLAEVVLMVELKGVLLFTEGVLAEGVVVAEEVVVAMLVI